MRLRAAGSFEFEQWFASYVVSPEAGRRLWSYCQKYGLRRHDLDDVRQDWFLRVSATVQRSGLPATVIDAEQATPYVLVAARRVAHDLACRGVRSREDVAPARDGDGWPTLDGAVDRFVGAGQASAVEPDEGQWCERIRARISRRLHARSVKCSGCRGPEVAQMALEIVNTVCSEEDEDDAAFEPWIAALRGGTTPFAKLMYQAIETVVPGRLDVDPQGRVSDRGRAYKRRCEPCVVELLTDVIRDGIGHTEPPDADDIPGNNERTRHD